jgi:hypothetical protein
MNIVHAWEIPTMQASRFEAPAFALNDHPGWSPPRKSPRTLGTRPGKDAKACFLNCMKTPALRICRRLLGRARGVLKVFDNLNQLT